MPKFKFQDLLEKIQAFKEFVDPDNDVQFSNGILVSGDFEKTFSLNRAYLKAAETDPTFANIYPRSLRRIVEEYTEGGSGSDGNEDGGGDEYVGTTPGTSEFEFGTGVPYDPNATDQEIINLGWYYNDTFGWYWYKGPSYWLYSSRYDRWFWIKYLKQKNNIISGWVYTYYKNGDPIQPDWSGGFYLPVYNNRVWWATVPRTSMEEGADPKQHSPEGGGLDNDLEALKNGEGSGINDETGESNTGEDIPDFVKEDSGDDGDDDQTLIPGGGGNKPNGTPEVGCFGPCTSYLTGGSTEEQVENGWWHNELFGWFYSRPPSNYIYSTRYNRWFFCQYLFYYEGSFSGWVWTRKLSGDTATASDGVGYWLTVKYDPLRIVFPGSVNGGVEVSTITNNSNGGDKPTNLDENQQTEKGLGCNENGGVPATSNNNPPEGVGGKDPDGEPVTNKLDTEVVPASSIFGPCEGGGGQTPPFDNTVISLGWWYTDLFGYFYWKSPSHWIYSVKYKRWIYIFALRYSFGEYWGSVWTPKLPGDPDYPDLLTGGGYWCMVSDGEIKFPWTDSQGDNKPITVGSDPGCYIGGALNTSHKTENACRNAGGVWVADINNGESDTGSKENNFKNDGLGTGIDNGGNASTGCFISGVLDSSHTTQAACEANNGEWRTDTGKPAGVGGGNGNTEKGKPEGELVNIEPFGWCRFDYLKNMVWLEEYRLWLMLPEGVTWPLGPNMFPFKCNLWDPSTELIIGPCTISINPKKIIGPKNETIEKKDETFDPSLPPTQTTFPPSNVSINPLPSGWFFNKTFQNYYRPKQTFSHAGITYEWGESGLNNPDLVNAVYEVILKRPGEPDGMAYWTSVNYTLWELIDWFLISEEYLNMLDPTPDPRTKINWIYSVYWRTWIYIGELSGPDDLVGWVFFQSTESWYWITDGFIFIPGNEELNFLEDSAIGSQSIAGATTKGEKTGSNFEWPKFINDNNFGVCIIFSNNSPALNGWFWSSRYGWVYGNATTKWYYVFSLCDWFWFGASAGGKGWVFSFWHNIWFWSYYGSLTNSAGTKYSEVGIGGVTLTGFPSTNDKGNTSIPGSGNSSNNNNSGSTGPTSSITVPAPTSTVDINLKLVRDTVTNVLSYKTISDADGDIQVPDQVEVLGGESVCVDPANGTEIETWGAERIMSVADVKILYDTIFGVGNHGFVDQNSIDGGGWVNNPLWMPLDNVNIDDAFDGTVDTRYAQAIKDQLCAEPTNTSTKAFSLISSFFKEYEVDTTPQPPSDIAISLINSYGFQINWSDIDFADRYNILISETSDFSTAFIGTPDAVTHNLRIASSFKLFNDLDPNKTYYIKIRSEKSSGLDNSDYSEVFTVKTLKRETIAPTGLTANNETKNSVYLSWNLVSSLGTTIYDYNNQNSFYTHGYEAQYAKNAGFSDATLVNLVTSNPLIPALTLGGLDSDQDYFIRIRAKAGGDFLASDWSGTQSFKTLEDPLANLKPGHAAGGSNGTLTLNFESTNFVAVYIGYTTSDISIQWGDGAVEHRKISGYENLCHEYSSTGNYQVIVTGVIGNQFKASCKSYKYGDPVSDDQYNQSRLALKSAKVQGFRLDNFSNSFYECKNLESVDFTDFDSSRILYYSYLFYHCNNLTQVIGSTNLAQAVGQGLGLSFFKMFTGCWKLPYLDVTGWKMVSTSLLFGTSTYEMFYRCDVLTELEGIETWNTSSIKNARRMFMYCDYMGPLPIGGWDVSQMTDVREMFSRTGRFAGGFYNRPAFSADLSSWGLPSNVKSDEFADHGNNFRSFTYPPAVPGGEFLKIESAVLSDLTWTGKYTVTVNYKGSQSAAAARGLMLHMSHNNGASWTTWENLGNVGPGAFSGSRLTGASGYSGLKIKLVLDGGLESPIYTI